MAKDTRTRTETRVEIKTETVERNVVTQQDVEFDVVICDVCGMDYEMTGDGSFVDDNVEFHTIDVDPDESGTKTVVCHGIKGLSRVVKAQADVKTRKYNKTVAMLSEVEHIRNEYKLMDEEFSEGRKVSLLRAFKKEKYGSDVRYIVEVEVGGPTEAKDVCHICYESLFGDG